MSSVLYYSNYCDNCKTLLSILSKTSKTKEDMHFICIDNRIKENNQYRIILENGSKLLLPPNVTKVPALFILNTKNVMFGEEIYDYLKPKVEIEQKIVNPTMDEPDAYFLSNGTGMFGVSSDNYSFLDQSSDSMSAQGDGGLRQMHTYATIQHNDKIDTPDDDYKPDKIGEDVSIEKLQQERNNLK